MVVFGELFRKLLEEKKDLTIIYNGKEIILGDKIDLKSENVKIKLNIISTNSENKQGIILEVKKGKFIYANQTGPKKVVFWEDEWKNQRDIIIEVISKQKLLYVYNVWIWLDYLGNQVVYYGYNGAAMYVEEIQNGRKYYCNDGEPDDDFDDLIFTLEFVD